MVFGVVLRLLGFFDLELWADEAGWCARLIEGDYGWIRPIGYMWVTRELLTLQVSEPVLRSLSYVAGLAALPITYLVLRRAVQPPLAVVGTWLLAIHPIAVAMTKEFKPYAMEYALHVALVALALTYLAKGGARRLGALLVVALVAPLFAWTIIFAYPGVFTVVGLRALRERRRAHVIATAVGCASTLAVCVGLYLARLATKTAASGYWGRKYDVFYVDHGAGLLGYIGWSIEKTADLAAFPLHLQAPGGGTSAAALHVLSMVLCALGVVALLARKRWELAALVVAPWALTFAFNAARVWPYGLFRTNLYLLSYTLVLVVLGIDFLAGVAAARLAPSARRAAAIGAVVALCLTFPFDLEAFAHKRGGTLTAEASVLTALQRIYERETGQRWGSPIDDATARARGEGAAARRRGLGPDGERGIVLDETIGHDVPLLILDGHACAIMRYYRDYHSASSPVLRDWLPSHFVTKCSAFGNKSWKRLLTEVGGRSFWLVSAKSRLPLDTRTRLAAMCAPQVDEILPEWTLLYQCRAKPSAGAAPGSAPSAEPTGAEPDEHENAESVDDDP